MSDVRGEVEDLACGAATDLGDVTNVSVIPASVPKLDSALIRGVQAMLMQLIALLHWNPQVETCRLYWAAGLCFFSAAPNVF
ncbi:hypothetical protein PoB_005146900 [Plakobranchus ocellatus]|uniref:Uncharacterized protein n=1 Tax=Plakobranchus ocellatus TaxID=259542 RepID=A0AAV4BXN1_9GAST|nr:hypothetical protein PoB_005146900 [Plakobranchus ocellatus]